MSLFHRAPNPAPADEPFEEDLPGPQPLPADEPVPDHNPEHPIEFKFVRVAAVLGAGTRAAQFQRSPD